MLFPHHGVPMFPPDSFNIRVHPFLVIFLVRWDASHDKPPKVSSHLLNGAGVVVDRLHKRKYGFRTGDGSLDEQVVLFLLFLVQTSPLLMVPVTTVRVVLSLRMIFKKPWY